MPKRLLFVIGVEIALLCGGYLWASSVIARGFGLPMDDSWIYAVFARNLAEGKGLVFNPGQLSSPTGVLHALVLGLLYRVGLSPLVSAIVSGVALHFAASFFVYKIARQIELDARISAAAAIVFAATPRLVWGALSGMEVPLYVLLVSLGVYWQVRWKWNDGARAYLATAVFGLATLARPECGAFLAVSVLERLISSVRFGGEKSGFLRFVKTVPLHLLVYAAVVAPWVVFNLWAMGHPLPPAFYAKARTCVSGDAITTIGAAISGFGSYIGQAATVLFHDNAIITLLAAVGIALSWKWSAVASRASALVLPVAILVVPGVTGVLAHHEAGDQQLLTQTGRYSSYLVPLAVILAGIAVASLKPALERSGWLKRGDTVLALVLGCLILVGNGGGAIRYGQDVSCINMMQVALGKWAAKLPTGTLLAANDVGAIPYFSRLEVIDTMGVTDPSIVPYLHKYPGERTRGLMEYLAKRKPDYLIVFPTWYPEVIDMHDLLTPVKGVGLNKNTICGDETMIVYAARWPKSGGPNRTPGRSTLK